MRQARIRSARAACQTPLSESQRPAPAARKHAGWPSSPPLQQSLRQLLPAGRSPAEAGPTSPRTPQPGGEPLAAAEADLRQLLGLSSDAVAMLAERTRVVQVRG